MSIEVNLRDILTSHTTKEYGFRTFSAFIEPKDIKYFQQGKDVSVYTDKSLDRNTILSDPAHVKVAWIVECREVHPFSYQRILEVEDLLDYVFTFDQKLLDKGGKYKKSLIASTRIRDAHSNIYKKSKDISMIVSRKKWCSGHKFRHRIVDSLIGEEAIDLWGNAFREMPQGAKVLALAEYKYSIAIENSKDKNYFTEKIIDCFRTGTAPIYWGTSSISEYFNMDGVVCFETVEELHDILPSLTEERYRKMLPAIKENYQLAKKWCSMDDTFANNLKEVING
jgi:hypothetical protein